MAEQNTITIQFGAKGDKDVIDVINKLDKSTKKLIDTQAKLVNRNKQQKIQILFTKKSRGKWLGGHLKVTKIS